MGANQSSPALQNEKLIIERLRAMEIKEQSDDYIQVDEKALSGSSKTKFKAPWTAVSISEVEQWEHKLLQDAKNRYESPQLRTMSTMAHEASQTSTLCSKLRRP
jgi:bleomycin hydrolase